MIGVMVGKYYLELKNRTCTGEVKENFLEVEPCNASGCECLDYIGQSESTLFCAECLHSSAQHELSDESVFEKTYVAYAKKLATIFYEGKQSVEHDGTIKTDIEQIDVCKNCSCWDYDRNDDGSQYPPCECGCAWSSHNRQDEEKWLGVLLAVAAKMLDIEI
jgi:hypothetical protein